MGKLSILVLHNFYQHPGGEDQVFRAETAVLKENGHRLVQFTMHNQAVSTLNFLEQFAKTVWNSESYKNLRQLIRELKPNLIHVHNTLPLLSPSVYYAASAEGVPVLQSLHNYRLLCPSANFFRRGQVCQDCLGRAVPWPGIVHGCYRQSRAASAAVGCMLSIHRSMGTWSRMVGLYIASSEFSRNKFIEGGLPTDKIVVKPNFIHPDPGVGPGGGKFALFVGRLTIEKGLRTLLAAWKILGGQLPLKIVGDGPRADEVRAEAVRLDGVEWLGAKTPAEVYTLLEAAAFLVIPSEWFEAFGLVTIMAFAKGVPVLAARRGAVGEVNIDGVTGLQFCPGDPVELASKAEWLWEHLDERAEMGRNARREFEEKYTADRNYQMMMDIYSRAVSAK